MLDSLSELSLLLALAGGPHQFTMMDFWERRCSEGDETYCRRLESSRADLDRADRLERYADDFARRVERSELELDNRPVLRAAYPGIIADYRSREPSGAEVPAVDGSALEHCADHYHQFWLGRKLWWPTDDAGRPDWSVIYYYVVDHYHGVCLRMFP